MFGKFKELRLISREAGAQSVSIRRRLNLYWMSMALAVLAALMLILSITGVFSSASRNLREALKLQQQNSVYSLTAHTDALEARCITLSRQLSDEISDFMVSRAISLEDLNDNADLIAELEGELFPILNTTLQSSRCSGVFVSLDATCNSSAPLAEKSRMGLYLRYSDLSGVNSANKHMVYFRGASQVARDEKIQMHNRWNLEFDTGLFPSYQEILSMEVSRLADSCIWTERLDLKDIWEDAMLISLPVLDSSGRVIGLCGAELSQLYFHLSYPASPSRYGDMLLGLIPMEGGALILDGAMLGGSEDTALESAGALTIKEGRFYNRYSSGPQDYLGLHELLPLKTQSGRPLAALTLVSQSNFSRAENAERMFWVLVFLLLFLSMLALSKLLTRHFVSPIAQLVDAAREDRPLEIQRSGISEIDELLDYARSHAPSPSVTELPPNIEELFSSFRERVSTLTPMERTVLQYYIEGCSVEEVARRSFISVNTAKKHNTNINRKLGLTSREELLLYIDIFRRCGRLDEIAYHTTGQDA